MTTPVRTEAPSRHDVDQADAEISEVEMSGAARSDVDASGDDLLLDELAITGADVEDGEVSWVDEDEADETGEEARTPTPRAVSWTFRLFVMPLLALALTMTLGFLARTQLVLEPLLGPVLEREARARGVDLYIGTLRPSGLFGVKLERVRARIRRGPYVLDTRLDEVHASPSLMRFLRTGRPEPDEIDLRGGLIVLERLPGDVPDSPEKRRAAKRAGAGKKRERLPIRIVGQDLRLELKAGNALSSTRPLRLKRVEATIPLTGLPLPTELIARGHLPDETRFVLSSKPDPETKGHLFQLKPEHPTQLHHWFTDQMPFEMTTAGISVCSGCGDDRIVFREINVRLPNFRQGIIVGAPEAQARWDRSGRAALSMPGVAITSLHDEEIGVQLHRAQLAFDTTEGTHTGELDIRDRKGGVLQVSWLWNTPDRLLSGALDAQRFSMRPLLAMLEADPYFERGDLTGTIRGSVDMRTMLVDFSTRLTFGNSKVLVPPIAREQLEIERLRVDLDTAIDLHGRTLHVNQGRLLLGDNQPVTFAGALIHARKGWSFSGEVRARDMDPEKLRKTLPKTIARPIADARFAGKFGFDFEVGGHSAFPDSLKLKVKIHSDVQVLQDSSYADISALAANGAPYLPEHSALNQPTSIFDWVSYEELPSHIPRTLMSAEDARFLRHNGFDFGGLRRAMAHNLKVGRLERGGSTVTQQLIKNLYLSRQRTAVRKLQEAYLTWRVESYLSKQRIFEIYMNIAQWGDGVRGLSQAAHTYFKRDARELSITQTALLGTILPNPMRYGGYLLKGYIASSRVEKFEHIMNNLRYFGIITPEEYWHLVRRSVRGRFDEQEYIVCADDDTAPVGSPPCSEITNAGKL